MDKARERLGHLKLQYGENDPYYAGFAECLRLVEQTEGGWKSQRTGAKIMKALAVHFDEDKPCAECPYVDIDEPCHILLKKDVQSVIDLISRKNAECKECGSRTSESIEKLQKQIAEKNADIERLSVVAHLGNIRANDYRVMRDRAFKAEAEIEAARAEAIKEVYTRLSMNFGTYTDNDSVKLVDLFRLFDQIAKEMGVELWKNLEKE